MSQRFVWMPIGLVVVTSGLGCQVPTYQLPAGYSSTYARFLHVEEQRAEVPLQSPAAEPIPHPPGVFYPQTFQYDPPTRSEYQQAVRVPVNPNQARRRS